MDNDTRQCLIICTSIAMVVIAFIGGCTYNFKGGQEMNLKQLCIQSNASWQDGNCVR